MTRLTARLRKFVLVAPIAAAMSTALFSSAAAAGVPIPCTGERIVDYPKIAMPEGPKGEKLVLGFLMRYCSSGRWIAHVPGARSYFTLKPEGVEAMTRNGILPPEPGVFGAMMRQPKTFWVEWLWAVLVGLGVIGTMFASYAKRYDDARAA